MPASSRAPLHRFRSSVLLAAKFFRAKLDAIDAPAIIAPVEARAFSKPAIWDDLPTVEGTRALFRPQRLCLACLVQGGGGGGLLCVLLESAPGAEFLRARQELRAFASARIARVRARVLARPADGDELAAGQRAALIVGVCVAAAIAIGLGAAEFLRARQELRAFASARIARVRARVLARPADGDEVAAGQGAALLDGGRRCGLLRLRRMSLAQSATAAQGESARHELRSTANTRIASVRAGVHARPADGDELSAGQGAALLKLGGRRGLLRLHQSAPCQHLGEKCAGEQRPSRRAQKKATRRAERARARRRHGGPHARGPRTARDWRHGRPAFQMQAASARAGPLPGRASRAPCARHAPVARQRAATTLTQRVGTGAQDPLRTRTPDEQATVVQSRSGRHSSAVPRNFRRRLARGRALHAFVWTGRNASIHQTLRAFLSARGCSPARSSSVSPHDGSAAAAGGGRSIASSTPPTGVQAASEHGKSRSAPVGTAVWEKVCQGLQGACLGGLSNGAQEWSFGHTFGLWDAF